MVKHFYELFPADENWRARAERIAAKTFEFTGFLVNVLKIEDTGASFAGKLTWHDACHGLRDLDLRREPRALLKNVRGAEFVELEGADVCCGFGGSVSADYPKMAEQVLARKLDNIAATGVSVVVTDNPGCILHLRGGADAQHQPIRVVHIAELMAERIRFAKEE